MYSDVAKKRPRWLIPALAVMAFFLALVFFLSRNAGRDISEEGAAAIREAVRRSALQCYVVEGVYPPDLAYLEDNYGLQVNTEDYYVTYEAFSSNLPPTIRVMRK